MPLLENYTVEISVSKGRSLSKLNAKKKTWKTFRRMFSRENLLIDKSCSFAKYVAMDIAEQGYRKMQPGNWMPALFTDGVRKGPNQLCRTMVVFDLDYVTVEQLEAIREGETPISKYAWFMHTTRSHCPEKPRVRMIIPCDRAMSLEEANALTRYLACELAEDPEEGIEIPDTVSMKSNQVMYLPSISKDQDYWTDENEGEVVDVDAFLTGHPNWNDHALLPRKESEKNAGVTDPNNKMELPTEKPGIIGAFCRTYGIESAISEFIPEVYIPGDDSGTDTRYSYVAGGGRNGAIVYDNDLILYSNHGSDPIEGAANAWDMVRIHKFGHLDKNSPANTLLGNLPSSKAMFDMAKADPAVAAELNAHIADEFDDEEFEDDPLETSTSDPDIDDLLGGGDDDPDIDDLLGGGDDDDEEESDSIDDIFDDVDEEDEPKKKKPDMSWTADFRRKPNGDLEPVLNNIALICENDPRIKDSIALNEFTKDPVCLKPIKSKKISTASRPLRKDEKKRGRRWEEADDASIKAITSGNAARNGYETDFAAMAVQEAVLLAGSQRLIHPVKDDLARCYEKWQKAGCPTGFIDRLAIDYFGCPDTPFHRESSLEFLVGAITRIFEPGCKFDTMLILEGATGAGKSTFLKNLSMGHHREFRVDLDRIDRAVEQMRGNWFLEMAEMAKAKSSDSNLLKDFLSAQVDVIRLAYGKRELEFPRQSVMVGTSNEHDYLTDPTSVRRYWVWKISPTLNEFNQIDQAKLLRERDMLLGEAYQVYLDRRKAQPQGELHLGLKTHEAIREQREIAEGSRRMTATEAIAEAITEWLDTPVTADQMELLSNDPIDQEFDDDAPSGGPKFVRNMVTAKQAFEALRLEPVLQPYRNADVRTYGKALKLLDGWSELGQRRRHGQKAVWFIRHEDGPEWIVAGEAAEVEVCDLLS